MLFQGQYLVLHTTAALTHGAHYTGSLPLFHASLEGGEVGVYQVLLRHKSVHGLPCILILLMGKGGGKERIGGKS